MFRVNEQHLQHCMFDPFQTMSERTRQRLENSWAGIFYREVLCRIKEARFSVLYSDKPSRPNAPINVMVGAEILKAGHGWSDEELYEQIQFNLQVRYALGLRDLNTMPFELRTLYYFRQRLSQHMQETGENLLEQVFVQVTDEQLKSLNLRTGHQRMDSVLVSSNIRRTTRLALLVEVVQRVWRMLTEEDQTCYADVFEAYLRGTSGQYCYRLKGEEIDVHLEAVGQVMARLVRELEAEYATSPTYQMLKRVLSEHFSWDEGEPDDEGPGQLRLKRGKELSGESLQSPDDWEATYREKRGQGHRGYVANLTETCDPENRMQLILHVQVAPNLTDDEDMVIEAVPELKARTDLKVLWTDGGYTGPRAEVMFRKNKVEHMPTNLRGSRPAPDRIGLDEFEWEVDEEGVPHTVRCPAGEQVPVCKGRSPGRFRAEFDEAICAECPLADRCRAESRKILPARVLLVSNREVEVARLRQRAAKARRPGHNWRSAVESTVRSVTHPFGGQSGKLPVRGQRRVAQVIICSALMVNLRRIWRYERELAEKKAQDLLSLLSRCGLHPTLSFRGRFVRLFPHLAPDWAKT